MSTSTVNEEGDVEFVSEGPLRPVLEYIDLLSDGEDEAGVCMNEDEVDRQKAQAASTLDRLARQVAVQKKKRAEKCKAFKEKVILQQAHGRRELADSHCSSEDSNDAKRCVAMWLKMPGLKPGVINTGTDWSRRSAALPVRHSPQNCPVLNCGRVYDCVPLLDGHLKRFDHSPCDPTIMLKGSPAPVYACVACARHFETKELWRSHMASKISSDASGHVSSQTCQMIACFACPACFLFFNIKDECLQHMAAKSHFTHSISLSGIVSEPAPIPVPQYVKNRLIALSKEVSFRVKCTICSKVLTSHMEAKAHFNVQCRQGYATAEADQTLTQIMKQLMVLGQCLSCTKIFFHQKDIDEHKEQTLHETQIIKSVEQALLVYSNYREIQRNLKVTPSQSSKRTSAASLHSDIEEKHDSIWSPAKRKRIFSSSSQTKLNGFTKVAFFCECGLKYMDEDTVSKHLLAINQIFYKCAVCGKLMSESSIARLHMSRFHGGNHLSNFTYNCRKCSVEMPRLEDIMSHVALSHHGHTYFEEREDTSEDVLSGPSQKACSSTESRAPVSIPPTSKAEERWMCRMCEDMFESEEAVHEHCSDLSSHSFQRFMCGHCPQKFFKESTLRRHCANEHNNQLAIRYFCGLCDSMLYDSHQEFMNHYTSLHSRDYFHFAKKESSSPIPQASIELPTTSKSLSQHCLCMGFQKSKDETKSTYTRCMKLLATEGKCTYACHRCEAKTHSYAEIRTHMYLKHESMGKDKSFDVTCVLCSLSLKDVPSFHLHYHALHCSLEPCVSSRINKASSSFVEEPAIAKIVNAKEIFPDTDAEEFKSVKEIIISSPDSTEEDLKKSQDTFDDEMKLALALSAEEAKKPTEFEQDMEEAVKRSLLDF